MMKQNWVPCFLYIPEIKASPFDSLALHSVSSDSNSQKIKLALSLITLPSPAYQHLHYCRNPFFTEELMIVCIGSDVRTIPTSLRENRGIVEWKRKEK